MGVVDAAFQPLGRYAELRLSRNNAGILGTISSGIGNTMFRFLLIALCLVCASAFNVGAGAAALRDVRHRQGRGRSPGRGRRRRGGARSALEDVSAAREGGEPPVHHRWSHAGGKR